MSKDNKNIFEDVSAAMTDYLAGELSSEQMVELDKIIEGSEEYKKEFAELQEIWTLTESVLKSDLTETKLPDEHYDNIFKELENINEEGKSGSSKPVKFMWMEIAASFILITVILGVILVKYRITNKAEISNDYQEIGKSAETAEKDEENGKDQPGNQPFFDIVGDSEPEELQSRSFSSRSARKKRSVSRSSNAIFLDGHATGYSGGNYEKKKQVESSRDRNSAVAEAPADYYKGETEKLEREAEADGLDDIDLDKGVADDDMDIDEESEVHSEAKFAETDQKSPKDIRWGWKENNKKDALGQDKSVVGNNQLTPAKENYKLVMPIKAEPPAPRESSASEEKQLEGYLKNKELPAPVSGKKKKVADKSNKSMFSLDAILPTTSMTTSDTALPVVAEPTESRKFNGKIVATTPVPKGPVKESKKVYKKKLTPKMIKGIEAEKRDKDVQIVKLKNRLSRAEKEVADWKRVSGDSESDAYTTELKKPVSRKSLDKKNNEIVYYENKLKELSSEVSHWKRVAGLPPETDQNRLNKLKKLRETGEITKEDLVYEQQLKRKIAKEEKERILNEALGGSVQKVDKLGLKLKKPAHAKPPKQIATPVTTEAETHNVLKRVIIPHIEFEGVTIENVIRYLNEYSNKSGVKIETRLSEEDKAKSEKKKKSVDEGDGFDVPTVTMVVDEIPLGQSIKYICTAANLKYRIEKGKVIIASKDIALDEMVNKTVKISKEEFDMLGGDNSEMKSYFMNNGVNIELIGSLFSYNKNNGTLSVKTTPANLKKVEEILSKVRFQVEKNDETKNGFPFIDTKIKPVSTFSIDVDTASYTRTRNAIKRGQTVDPASIRPEEFINYFDYHYRSPASETFGVNLEMAPSPFRGANYVMRVGVQGRKLGPDANRESSFTVLVDTSGSMVSKGRLDIVKKSLRMLVKEMKPSDKITILTCGTGTKRRIYNMPAGRSSIINRAIDGIYAGGETNLEKGIINSYDIALATYVPGGYNRVLIFSDGIVQIGSKSAEDILKKVENARVRGVSNTIIGVGGDGDDKMMETLADKGDGNYVFLDTEEAAENLFKKEFSARFREIARDVKIQVEFNPKEINKYRQIGYKNRQLSKADFRNDKVDAGEVGAGQSVTALYETKLAPETTKTGRDEIVATVRVRYKRSDNMEVEEEEFYLKRSDIKKSYAHAQPNFKLAVLVSEFSELLGYPNTPGISNLDGISTKLRALVYDTYKNDKKVKELYNLLENYL